VATTLTIGGAAVNLSRTVALGKLLAFSRGGYPTLSFYKRGGKLPASPDPYLGKEVVLAIGGTTYFTGDVVSAHPEYQDHLGWVTAYMCHGLRSRGDRFPHTDSNDGTDTSAYNLTIEDGPAYNPARAGRTVGEIVADVLAMTANAAALTAYGIGAGTDTAADLAATPLALIPPSTVSVQGEKFLTALEGFLAEWAPCFMLHIQPADGQIRVLDTRTFTPTTFTLGTDPVEPTPLSRDWSDCFGRVVVRGASVAVMALLKLSKGDLAEAFDHDGLSSSAAKSAWKPSDFHNPATGAGQAQDYGDCTCSSTTTISITNSRSTTAYTSNYWDQTTSGRHGTITLRSSSVTGITQFWHARVISNTAQSAAGGSFSITIDVPLPHTNFDSYTLNGLASLGPNRVYTRYQITNTDIIPKLTSQSTYPQPFINGGGGVSLTSSPIGAVLWPISGTAQPFNTFPLPFTYQAGDPYIYFAMPTYLVAGKDPADVWALVPYYQTSNQVASPPDSGGPVYAGTVNTVEGREDTLTVQVLDWRDPAATSQMQDFADELLASVQDTVVEGAISYLGLLTALLTPGTAANVTGDSYTTGWETLDLPIVECELEWPLGGPTSHRMSLHCSNRRSHLSYQAFLKPERTFATPFADFLAPFGEFSAGAGVAFTAPEVLSGFGPAAPLPQSSADLGLPTSPGEYLQSQGAPTAPRDLGIATTPGEAGMVTTPGQYLGAQGLARTPGEYFGGGNGTGAAPPPPELEED
jgi:hypothetical protein